MIYTVTLNPAIDTILNIQGRIGRGKNNRISKRIIDVGGKGTHVSVGLALLDVENICTGITGENGFNTLNKLLKGYGVKTDFLVLENLETRQNIVLTDDSLDGSIMITENGIPLTYDIIDRFFEEKLSGIKEKDYVIVSGNPSKETSVDVFEYFLNKVNYTGAKIIVDVSGENLDVAFQKKLELIKPNQYEFSEIVGFKVTTISDCIKAYQENIDRFSNIRYLCISLGKEGSLILSKEGGYAFKPANVNNVNDTGAGDAFVSGLVYGLVNNFEIEELGKIASSTASANVEESTSSGFKVPRVHELIDEVKIEKVEV